MKRVYSKPGLGLIGMLACAGCLAAGAQYAQAEFTLLVPPSPTITIDANHPGYFNWTYTLGLGATASASSGSYFDFALSADSGYQGYAFNLIGGINSVTINNGNPTQYNSNGQWNISENTSGYYAQATYVGSSAIPSNSSLGTFTIITTDGSAGSYSTPTSFTQGFNANGISGPKGYYISSSSSYGNNFASLLNPGTTNADFSGQSVVVPSLSGNIPESPLPLPPEFWPSVLTLAGMAAVGGLRLRNRAL
ncbi:MAG: hypothetical protein M0Z50_11315 [Planctomycetia bacterium]|nr:hypothetical protein [Planctomycetia bacterium]